MANEITVTSQLQVRNGAFVLPPVGGVYPVTQVTAGGGNPGTISVGTSEETVSFGDLVSPAWVWMVNLDDTNYVQWGFSTGVYGGRLKAEKPAGPFELEPAATLYMKANTAACLVQIIALEL